MSTIAEWLASLGMAEYTERFAENGWFTDGFDTPALQDARALLEQLQS